MKVEATPATPAGEQWAPLVDLSRLPLNHPTGDGDGVVDQALRRVLRSLHDPDGVISSFGSFIADA
jgi:hypothetical protein